MPAIPVRFIHSRSAVIPSLVTLPFIQCHQARGLAESGGFLKPLRRGSSFALCARTCAVRKSPVTKAARIHVDRHFPMRASPNKKRSLQKPLWMVTSRKTTVNHREKNPQRFAMRKMGIALDVSRTAPGGERVTPLWACRDLAERTRAHPRFVERNASRGCNFAQRPES